MRPLGVGLKGGSSDSVPSFNGHIIRFFLYKQSCSVAIESELEYVYNIYLGNAFGHEEHTMCSRWCPCQLHGC